MCVICAADSCRRVSFFFWIGAGGPAARRALVAPPFSPPPLPLCLVLVLVPLPPWLSRAPISLSTDGDAPLFPAPPISAPKNAFPPSFFFRRGPRSLATKTPTAAAATLFLFPPRALSLQTWPPDFRFVYSFSRFNQTPPEDSYSTQAAREKGRESVNLGDKYPSNRHFLSSLLARRSPPLDPIHRIALLPRRTPVRLKDKEARGKREERQEESGRESNRHLLPREKGASSARRTTT